MSWWRWRRARRLAVAATTGADLMLDPTATEAGLTIREVTGRLDGVPVVQPIVSFEEAVAAYRQIDEHPERSVKLGVRFASE